LTRCVAQAPTEERLETTGQQQGGEGGARVIKRYANRKLYDTRESRYVTLQQIAKLVREGEDVAIIDNTTKEDLTNVTLAQIIYEEEKNASETDRAVASVGTLRHFIQQGGERLMTSLREGPVGKLIARKDEAPKEEVAPEPEPEPAKEPKRLLSRGGPRDKSVFASQVFTGPKEAFEELQRLADDRMRGLLGHAITHVQQLQGEVKRLQARIEELEEKLVKLGRRKKDDDPAAPPDEA
jgi:polyhydroxyalkanoate synthesis repressor PhaR